MPKLLSGTHAEDVGGGRVVEVGQPIPADADPEVVKRLEAQGLITQTRAARKPKPSEEE